MPLHDWTEEEEEMEYFLETLTTVDGKQLLQDATCCSSVLLTVGLTSRTRPDRNHG